MRCPQIWAGVEEGCAPLGEGRALGWERGVRSRRAREGLLGEGHVPPFAKKGRLACVQAA
jgi:hypothetical protein